MRLIGITFSIALMLAGCAPAAAPSPTTAPAKAPPASPPAKEVAKVLAKPEHSAEIQRLIGAARDKGERELNLSWAEDTLGGIDGAKRYEALVNKMYGLNIAVNFTPGNLRDVTGRVTQEVAARQPAVTDVLLGSDTHFGPMLDKEIVEQYDYSALSPRVLKELVAPKNIGVEVASRVGGITYNPNLVAAAEVPKKLEDVLDPKWKGKIASTPTAIGFDRVAYRSEWGPDKMKAFMSRFSQQVGGIIRVVEQQRIASGEFSMLVLNSGSQEVRKLQAKGAPVEQAIPEDAVVLAFYYLGVPRNSSHPNLAKLFINAVLSEDGQKIAYETGYQDHNLLPGSQVAKELSDLQAKGIRPLKADVQFVADHPEITQLAGELEKALRPQ